MGTSLLPPNATEFERKAETALRFDALDDAIDAVGGFKGEVPEQFAAWLAAEWFLADFSRHFPTAAALIAAGLPWLRQRGTTAAVQRALGWIDLDAVLEEDGARLHLDPGTPAAPERLADVRHLVERSIPAHVRFYRLFHGYDIRHLRLDRSRLDDALLDDDSGVVVDGLKLSFGTRAAHAFAEPADAGAIDGAAASIYSVRVFLDDSWRLDAWLLDSEILLDAAGRVIEQYAIVLNPEALGSIVSIRWSVVAAVLDEPELTAVHDAAQFEVAHALPTPDVRAWLGPWVGRWRTPVISHALTQLET
ncbi:phage tail protein [Thauera butanivorans]|uniref:phage tail protein n=1 Tax=Thauera butanivorans TaxID=86174 RepID=UPI00083974D4|nr:phage tail protein [Thauera butanivorans]